MHLNTHFSDGRQAITAQCHGKSIDQAVNRNRHLCHKRASSTYPLDFYRAFAEGRGQAIGNGEFSEEAMQPGRASQQITHNVRSAHNPSGMGNMADRNGSFAEAAAGGTGGGRCPSMGVDRWTTRWAPCPIPPGWAGCRGAIRAGCHRSFWDCDLRDRLPLHAWPQVPGIQSRPTAGGPST